jgi:PTS system mannose-specific IIA component
MSRIGGVIITHGQLANELVAAAEAVVGDLTHIRAVSIGWHDDVEIAKQEISRAISEVECGLGVLLLTDMFGGTPTNIAAMFLDDGKIEVVTGVNLPMVIKLATATAGSSLSELARTVQDQGKESISIAGDLLVPRKGRQNA